jgi:hypothetical protein
MCPGVHDAGAHPILLFGQVPLDGQLVDAVLPVGVLGRILGGGDDGAGTVGPDASRVDDVLTVECVDQLARLLRCEAGQVHDRVGPQPGDHRPELAVLFGRVPVAGHHFDCPPCGIVAVRPTRSATDDDGVVPGFDQARH